MGAPSPSAQKRMDPHSLVASEPEVLDDEGSQWPFTPVTGISRGGLNSPSHEEKKTETTG